NPQILGPGQRLDALVLQLFPVRILAGDDRVTDPLLRFSGRDLFNLRHARVQIEIDPDWSFPIHRRQQLLNVYDTHCPNPTDTPSIQSRCPAPAQRSAIDTGPTGGGEPPRSLPP